MGDESAVVHPQGWRRRTGLGAGTRAARKAMSQAGLVAALWVVFTACATTVGAGALLVTAGSDRALSAAVAEADGDAEAGSPDGATMLVAAAQVDGQPAATADVVIPLARNAFLHAATGYDASVSVWATTPMLFLPGTDVRRGYLLDADSVGENATLIAGAWPSATTSAAGPIEAAVPSTTAAALGVGVGDSLQLSEERQHGAEVPAGYQVIVVGVFEPTASVTWQRDPLRGAGFDPNYDWLPAYGPFVVPAGTLELRAAPFSRISAVLDPDLAADPHGIPALVRAVNAAPELVRSEAGPGLGTVAVRSDLSATFNDMRSELSLTHSLVMSVLLIVVVLGLATTALVARVLARRRANEQTLMRDRGASVRQLTSAAVAESAMLAVLAILAATPLALAGYDLLANSRRLAPSWAAVAAPAPALSVPFIVAVIVGAVVPAALVVMTLVPAKARKARQLASGPIARSGLDVMLAVIAVVMWLQLRSHVVTPGAVDPMLVIAPATCVIASAALVARVVPLIAQGANAAARRAHGIVFPLAGWQAARGGAAHGTFLVVLAAAVGTLGVAFLGTWSQSQSDQAEAIVGADMVVARAGSPGLARELTAASGGRATPVATDAVVLGSRPDGVKLVAVDTTVADDVIRGRLPGSATWSGQTSGLAPVDQGAPIGVRGPTFAVTITGGVAREGGLREPPAIVTATPTFVLTDDVGEVITVAGTAVPLDGEPHKATLPTVGQQRLPAGEWRIVAIDVSLGEHGAEDLTQWGNSMASMRLTAAITGGSSEGATWDAIAPGEDGMISPGPVSVASGTVEAEFSYSVLGLSWQDAHLTLVSFPAATAVPVVVTSELARQLDVVEGDQIAMTWGTTRLDAVVVRSIPYVPSRVGDDAVLADIWSLQRALLSAGEIGPIANEWWLSAPAEGAADALRADGLGPVTSAEEKAHDLRDGPLRVALKFAWAFAIVAAVALAIAGTAAHATGEAMQRASSTAKLRAIGVPRRVALASHLLHHAAITLAATALGAAVGAALAVLLVPLLVVAPGGHVAVPAVVLVWSTIATGAVVAAIAMGGVLVGIPSALAVVRRSTVAALRAGDAS